MWSEAVSTIFIMEQEQTKHASEGETKEAHRERVHFGGYSIICDSRLTLGLFLISDRRRYHQQQALHFFQFISPLGKRVFILCFSNRSYGIAFRKNMNVGSAICFFLFVFPSSFLTGSDSFFYFSLSCHFLDWLLCFFELVSPFCLLARAFFSL